MAQKIEIIQAKATPPTVVTRDLSMRIALFSSRLERHANPRHYSISNRFSPTATDRSLLEARRQELTSALVPARSEAAMKLVSVLRQAFPAQKGIDAETTLKLYASALAEFPEWSISQACRDYLEGRRGEGEFAPPPPKLAQTCRSICLEPRSELVMIDRILDAAVYREPTDEERVAINEKFAALAKELIAPENKGEAA